MRLNIIRHRETLLKYLGNIDDTTLRNKINKLHPSNVIDSNLIEELKQESPVKVEVKEEVIYEEQPKPKSEDEISVGSNNEWQSICESKIETPVETRRSSRLELVKKDAHHSTRREDCKYIIHFYFLIIDKYVIILLLTMFNFIFLSCLRCTTC
jgi:hypothetical protein